MNVPIIKKILLLVSILFFSVSVFAVTIKRDTVSARIDSLKKQLTKTNDTLKGKLYAEIAGVYIKHDTTGSPQKRWNYKDKAIDNTISAIRYYSRYNDTAALVSNFDILARLYHDQKKYTQAKWFILQSNTLSRDKNDTTRIISSLLELASVKSDIKDYDLALRDLHEALMLSSAIHLPMLESQVELSYVMLYNAMKDHTKAAIALKRHIRINDSIRSADEQRIARIDSLRLARKKAADLKKQEALQAQLKKRNSEITILIVCLALVVISILLLYRKRRSSGK